PDQRKVTEKPDTPQPETPQQIVTKTKPDKKPEKSETRLPTTGGKDEHTYRKWIGLACIALGAIGGVFAVSNRKTVQ
ncbi:adhesin, partial [Bacillus pseudomycoides]|nr:adhesin [Bacillus pseudomycoides]